MTDIIIVHSKHGNSKNHWYEWLRHNLTLEGYDVSLFNLEANDHAQIDEWVNEMKQQRLKMINMFHTRKHKG